MIHKLKTRKIITKNTYRLKEIDIASGIAIVLVVLGHSLDYLPENFKIYKNLIYKFHMPFFMVISGFLFYISIRKVNSLNGYKGFVWRKLKRLGVSYLLVSLIYLLIKLVLYPDTSSINFNENLLNIFVNPSGGIAIFLWYIYVLLIFYVVFPLLFLIPLVKKYKLIMIFLGFILYLVNPKINIFEIELLCKYFLYFSIGIVLSENYNVFKKILFQVKFIAIIPFMILIILVLTHTFNSPSILLSFMSIPALFYISILSEKVSFLEYLGRYTFSIYLWHSLFLFLTALIFISLDDDFKLNAIYYLPIFLISGIIFPLTIRFIIRHFKLKLLYKVFP